MRSGRASRVWRSTWPGSCPTSRRSSATASLTSVSAGEGRQSPLWAQILADALDRPVHRLAEPRATNARGAAFLAFADLGLLLLDDVPSLFHVEQVHDPDPATRAVMDAALARLGALHPALTLN